MSREIGRKIGASVGVVEAVDADARGMGWGEFLRVKILMDLAKPLQRGRKINIEGKAHWIHFQYERLPRFCFQCGAICHGKSGCPKRSSFRQQEPNQYGMWLRAPSPTRRAEKSHNMFPAKKSQFNYTFTRGKGSLTVRQEAANRPATEKGLTVSLLELEILIGNFRRGIILAQIREQIVVILGKIWEDLELSMEILK
jgi:hypothetical protein